MAAGVAHLVGLLHRQDAGRVRPLFELWPHELGAARFDHEVRSGATASSSGVASTAPRTAGGPIRQAAHTLDDGRALDVGIERVRRANLHRKIAPHLDRIDGDDRGRAGDARALDGAQAERSAADNGDDGSRCDGRERTRGGRAKTGHADATQHHSQIDRGRLRHHRDDPFLEGDHQLGETADVRVGVDRRPVTQIGDRYEIGRQVTTEQLTDVGASAQAVIAGAALRRARHADAIADLNAAHFGSDGFDHTDTAVALHQRHRIRVDASQTHRRLIRRWSRGRSGLNPEHGADVRITEVARLGADDHLASADRSQPHIVQRGAATAGATRDPGAERAIGNDGGCLSLCRRG